MDVNVEQVEMVRLTASDTRPLRIEGLSASSIGASVFDVERELMDQVRAVARAEGLAAEQSNISVLWTCEVVLVAPKPDPCN